MKEKKGTGVVIMKKILCVVLALSIFLLMTGCGKKKTLHCDRCNAEVIVDEKNNMEEDWTIYCEACNEELFGDDPVLGND